MSVPATKARSPAPVSTRTRISGSSATAAQTLPRPSYIANVMAFRDCGRLNVTQPTGPRRSKSRSLLPVSVASLLDLVEVRSALERPAGQSGDDVALREEEEQDERRGGD